MIVSDLVRQALINAGIPMQQTIYAEDMYRGFDLLNMMIPQWSRKRNIIYNLIDVSCVATGATSYTIGDNTLVSSPDFNTPRPDRLEAAYVRLWPVTNDQPLDTWLTIIEAHEDYAKIALKNMQSYPMCIFYDSGYPAGRVYPWPVPNADQYEIHLILKNQITAFAALTTTISLPPEYYEAIVWNLAARLRTGYGLPPDETTARMAVLTLNTIRQANDQVRVLGMPMGYPTSSGGNMPPWQAGMTS